VRPTSRHFQLAPYAVCRHSAQLHAFGEPIANLAVQLNRNFATAALRLQDVGESDELVDYSGVSYS
jgi:hypothetical protein